jgi:alginate O-acetyltransferase complex protein AlgI
MLFNSFAFVCLLLATLPLYYLPPLNRHQVGLLIAASFCFYAYGQPHLLILLVCSAGINAVASYQCLRRPERALPVAVAGVAANLAVLGFFKYSGLLATTLFQEALATGSLGELLLRVPLPVGISFFTFQGISLVADAYSGRVERLPRGSFRDHLGRTTFFICFFPQLVAGPIVKARHFLPQIRRKTLADVHWEAAFKALILGYFLKMVVADNLRDQTFWLAWPYLEGYSTAYLLTLVFGFSMQIFADFAGYSLIAIGTARLFGYELPENFRFPYVSRSFAEFWRRWHISLSTWLKDYLYIPLGGNRKGDARTYANLLAVMLLGGLWHGAAWSFAVWGLWHGVALALERPFLHRLDRLRHPLADAARMAVVFCFVTLAWLLFKLSDFDHVLAFVRSAWANTGLATNAAATGIILLYSLPVLGYHALHLARERDLVPALPRTLHNAAYGAMLALIGMNSGPAGAFIYFQF